MTCARQHFAPHVRPLLTVEGPQGPVARAYPDGPQLMYFVWDANDLSNEDIERIETAAEVGGGRVRVWDEDDLETEYRITRDA